MRSKGGTLGGNLRAAFCCDIFADAVEERAAILEYDAGLSRADADRRARILTSQSRPCSCDAFAEDASGGGVSAALTRRACI